MGNYLNPTPFSFQESLDSQIYVDKSLLIREMNAVLNTQQKFVCVSRPRRFGKSMAVNMLSAYYCCGQDTHTMFDGLKISGDASYEQHLNRYNVIRVNMQRFLSDAENVDGMLKKLTSYLLFEILDEHTDLRFFDRESIVDVMNTVTTQTGRRFVILIDEWDCLFREYKEDTDSQRKYLDFLRMWLKDQDYVALAYMTGILPVKKYGTHSALNMFSEYSMTEPGKLAPFFGFTEEEVKALCDEYKMSFEEAQSWYDGYELSDNSDWNHQTVYSMYSPRSIVESLRNHKFSSYWNQTESYEALKIYIQVNMDGLKDAILQMLTGTPVHINFEGFTNDMTTFANRDDILTLLVHLGYLSYHPDDKTVTIPNKEVSRVYLTSIERIEGWHEVARAMDDSRKLLDALIAGDGETVAQGIDRAHEEISILTYNDENSLSCCIHLAFFFAREYYTIARELPAGKGFADVVLIPRQLYADKPAVVIELKYDKSAAGAISQIKEKHYCDALKDYHGNLLLAGINYDKETKKHSCIIEKADWD